MKIRLLFVALFSSIALMTSQALALSLSLEPDLRDITPGNLARLVLVISGLNFGGPDSLGAFDVEITYDENIVSFNDVLFGSLLGVPDGDLGAGIDPPFETDIFIDTSTPGLARLQETSLLFAFELDILQDHDPFELAELQFRGENLGVSPIGFGNVDLSDAFGFSLPNPIINGAKVNVVPEPATIVLFGASLLAVAGFRKKLRIH